MEEQKWSQFSLLEELSTFDHSIDEIPLFYPSNPRNSGKWWKITHLRVQNWSLTSIPVEDNAKYFRKSCGVNSNGALLSRFCFEDDAAGVERLPNFYGENYSAL